MKERYSDVIVIDNSAIEVYLASPEDLILKKLEWFRMGGEISEKQLNDIIGIFKVQKDLLDYEYIMFWAKELNLTDLMERIFQQLKSDF